MLATYFTPAVVTEQMDRVQQSTEHSATAKREAGDYWLNRISLVEAELATLA
jgi:hypothetical protein